MNMNLHIYVVVNSNPRRERSQGYYAFQLYRNGMTVAEYFDADYDNRLLTIYGWTYKRFKGPDMRHLKWDLDHKYIALRRK